MTEAEQDIAIGGKLSVSVPLEFLWAIRERAENIKLLSDRSGDYTEQARYCEARKIIQEINRLIRPESPDDLLEKLNTYEIRDPKGKLLTTVQGNDPRSVLGIMMLVWGEGIRVTQVNEAQNDTR